MKEIKKCVFCNIEDNFTEEQILYRGKYFYLVVPKGQIVEGYMIISPYKCDIHDGGIRSLSTAPKEVFKEMKAILEHIKKFYEFSYNIDSFSYYEQGRGAMQNEVDDLNAFPIHSHVCTLPSIYNFQEYMKNNYKEISLSKIEDIEKINTYYLLLSYVNNSKERICAYTGKTPKQIEELSHFRFKKVIASCLGCEDREQWRLCADIDQEAIGKVLTKYRSFINNNPNIKI